MNELTQLRDAVLRALQRGGLQAEPAFPEHWASDGTTPLATVSLGAADGKNLAFCGYLGQLEDAAGRIREVYGKRLEGTITLELRARRAGDCRQACETASAILLGGLPEGIRPGELSWEGLVWERETELFLRRGSLRCEALFLAQEPEDGSEFLDFMLKGVFET